MKYLALSSAALTAAGVLLATPVAVAAPSHDTEKAPASSAAAKLLPAASPQIQPVRYNNACGAGYAAVDYLQLSNLGTSWLTYNKSNGKNCAVTIRTTPGTNKLYMGVALQLAGNSSTTVADYGYYLSYAGPVYISAPGKCIDWYAQIDDEFGQEYGQHCGG